MTHRFLPAGIYHVFALGSMIAAPLVAPWRAGAATPIPEAARVHPAAERLASSALDEIKLWVFFTDKGLLEGERAGALEKARSGLSERCLDRRARRARGLGALWGERDLPVHGAYLTALEATGAELRRTSRWLNGVSLTVAPNRLSAIAALPFVAEVRPVAHGRAPQRPRATKNFGANSGDGFGRPPVYSMGLDYGYSRAQLEQIDLIPLHEAGYSGAGVTVAMFDTGFRKSHESLAGASLVAEQDFVFDDDDTEDEPEDEPGAMWHGTATWSIVGGWAPGTLIGGAYGADFILAKTEDIRSEERVEEDNWVAAMEWAEGLGADVISSSLAYLYFDDGFSYLPSELDGRTAVTTLAALEAARLGVVVCTAMANNGPGPSSIWTPADADSILSVGAVDRYGWIEEFSSRGPTADNRIKPDVCARGSEAVAASSSSPDEYSYYFSGTSAATPFVASAAAVLLEMHPDWAPQDMIEAMRSTATRAGTPDNDYGWGIVQAADAGGPVGIEDGEGSGLPGRALSLLPPAPNPFNPRTSIRFHLVAAGAVRLSVHDATGRLVRSLVNGRRAAGGHSVVWDGGTDAGLSAASGVYTIRLETESGAENQPALLIR